MAAREAGIWSKAVAVVFTSVVAPVLVTVITQGLKLPGESQAREAAPRAEERDILIGHGVGSGPDAACRDALRNALLRVVEQTVSPTFSASDRIAICERILREPQGIFIRWDRLSCRREVVAGTVRYRAEISTEIKRSALQDWLQSSCRPS